MGTKHKSKQVEKEGTLPNRDSMGQNAGIKKAQTSIQIKETKDVKALTKSSFYRMKKRK